VCLEVKIHMAARIALSLTGGLAFAVAFFWLGILFGPDPHVPPCNVARFAVWAWLICFVAGSFATSLYLPVGPERISVSHELEKNPPASS
jgi:multisubunit Na+/H+ antiporter MnhB subunit